MSGAALPPVCLLAGGLGTRLGEHVRDTPKPLLTVAGEPFLHHQLRLLADHGAREVVLCVGYLGERIERAIGAARFGLRIRYSYDGPEPIGTLAAIRKARPLLGDRFLVLYGDTFLRLDYRAAVADWERSGRLGLMTVLRNEGAWDSSNAELRDDGTVAYDKRDPPARAHWIDYGLGGLQEAALGAVGEEVSDLAELYRELSGEGQLHGVEVTERFYEIGTPAALRETDAFLSSLRRDRAP